MIERDILKQKIKEFQVKEFLEEQLFGAGYSTTEIKRTPLGEKIIIHTSRPGMVVGRSGKNIKDLTEALKVKFNLENPQIEINEVKKASLDSSLMAEKIAVSLQRFGSNRFKNIIHKAAEEIMNAGAKGVEILLSGKVPSARARTWRVSQGYLKKCGEPALTNVDISYKIAKLKSGVVGVVVKIMPPEVKLPDYLGLKEKDEAKEETSENKSEEEKTVADTEAESDKEKREEEKEPEKENTPEEPVKTLDNQDGLEKTEDLSDTKNKKESDDNE